MSEQLVQLKGITKLFPGVRALQEVSLNIEAGEVHGLVGENGAGKTTLLRLLGGIYEPDKGEIMLDGDPVSLMSPLHATAHGIAAVHQELSLCESMSIADNIFFGTQPAGQRLRFIRRKALKDGTQRLLDLMGLSVSPTAAVAELNIAEQQQVEILKALALKPRLLLLDEPTSALSDHEISILFKLLASLKQEGITIVYVSHKLHEVMQLCDTISVLRDGENAGVLKLADATEEALVHMMTGRKASDLYPDKPRPSSSQPKLEVQGLQANVDNLHLRDINLKVLPGEIVGIAGLVGSGRTEMAETLFGVHPKTAGTFLIDGKEVTMRSPAEAIKRHISYVPEDRKESGLFLRMSVVQNVVANKLPGISRSGFLSSKKAEKEANNYVSAFNIKVSNRDQLVGFLSGGNQQKIMLARFLATAPDILIIDEPTRGIDVGAKREIHFLLRELADQGTAILMISSELEEVLGLANRLYVMYQGMIISEMASKEATDELIMQAIVTAAREWELKSEHV